MENNGDTDRGSMLVRCASQSSLDESSQRVGSRAPRAPHAADSGDDHAGKLLGALAALRRDRALCDVLLCARDGDMVGQVKVTEMGDRTMPESESESANKESEDTESKTSTVTSTANLCETITEQNEPIRDDRSEEEQQSESSNTEEAAEAKGSEVVRAERSECVGSRVERSEVLRCNSECSGDSAIAVPAHRAVLAACSPYFRAMFTQFDEKTMHTITIQNVDPQALEMIVEYIYNPESLCITEDNVQALLSASSLLQVSGVRQACCSFLASALTAENALGIRGFADLHACTDLAQLALRYIERHFLEIVQHDEFLTLDVNNLCEILSSDSLCTGGVCGGPAGGEEAVLDAALRWVRHDERERLGYLADVLEQVRLPLLPHEVLVARAQQPPLRQGAVAVKDLIIEALSFHLLRPSRRPPARRHRPRAAPQAPQLLLVVGGQAPKAIREVEAYELDTGRWLPCRPLLSRRCRAGLALLDGKVYAVGGFNGTLRVRSVDIYDPARDTWSCGPPLCARRSTLGVCALGGKLYAVGGFDGATGLCSAEVFDPAVGAWRAAADMRTRRSSVGVAALEGRVYAVGGYDGANRQCLNTVERYDPATDRWEPVESMSARRSGAGVGVCGGALWALGGHDGPAVRRSVERYCPGTGWSAAPPMLSARRNAAVLTHGGKIYVVGGDDGATNLNTVEVFDPETEQWTELEARMSTGRSYAGVALIERPN